MVALDIPICWLARRDKGADIGINSGLSWDLLE